MQEGYRSYHDDVLEEGNTAAPSAYEEGRAGDERVNLYETSVNMPMGTLSALAYALPPFSGMLLLLFEYKNDYVRFHAYQSTLFFLASDVLILLFSFSRAIFWLILIVDFGLMCFLGRMAWLGSEPLRRYKLPFFGALADRWTDSE